MLDDVEKKTKRSFSNYLTVYYFMTALLFDVFLDILLRDAILSIASVFTVFVYIWVSVGSLFLALVGISEILLSLPVAWFFCRVILQIKYFGGLNLLCLFIVCAVGADDVFVFNDAYVQSQFKGPKVLRDFPTRMSWVYRKAGLAMLITSGTCHAHYLSHNVRCLLVLSCNSNPWHASLWHIRSACNSFRLCVRDEHVLHCCYGVSQSLRQGCTMLVHSTNSLWSQPVWLLY